MVAMKNLSANEIEKLFTINQLRSYNCKLRSELNDARFKLNLLTKNQESIIQKQVEERTSEYASELKEKDKIIETLKLKLAKMQAQLDNDSSNSGLPTSKTAIGKKKYIPNCREKSGKRKGGQPNHKKAKMQVFEESEATEIAEITPTECKFCHSKNITKLNSCVDKEELDYDVIIIKRINRFYNCHCNECNKDFHENIPNSLKEDIQYGRRLQSLAVCLTNDIYTPFNKTVKLISGITNGEINMSEGYVTKLQKRAAGYLEDFIEELKSHIIKSPVYGWDDGVVSINKKDGILRTYCTDNTALFIGHEKKDEAGLDDDGILVNTANDTIVMHDHLIHNYNEKYSFKNVECMIHLIRRLKKAYNETNHDWCTELISLLSKANKDRNALLKDNKDNFSKAYLSELDKNYNEIIAKAQSQNEASAVENYFFKEEASFIKDLIKYKKNYLLWAYDFSIPSTNNNSERNIRPIKSKMKISGQFQSIDYVKYYATIRSYIETCKKNGINIIDACVKLMDGKHYTLEEILAKKTTK